MLQKLQTTLNSNFSQPKHREHQPRISRQINNVEEFIFNTSITSDPDTTASIQKALNGTEIEDWKL